MNIGLSNEEREAVGMDFGDRRRNFWGTRGQRAQKRRNLDLSAQ